MNTGKLKLQEVPVDIQSLFEVRGKTVLITGGGRGIGFMIAEGFSRNGADVYLVSRDAGACEAAAAHLNKKHAALQERRLAGRVVALPSVDLASGKAECQRLLSLLQGLGVARLDVLVNNAGASWGEPMEQYSEKGWDKVMALNVKAVFYTTVALLPLLRAAAHTPLHSGHSSSNQHHPSSSSSSNQQSPPHSSSTSHVALHNPARVINIGSVVGIQPQAVPTFAYDASKAAVHHLTKHMASVLVHEAITVNAIAPGLVPSKMASQLTVYADEEALVQSVPLGRLGNPADMAGAALFLASPAGAWVSGIVIPVDGGQLLPGAMAIGQKASL